MVSRKPKHLTFAQFMERALYDPKSGYYTSRKKRIGKAGDYITSPTVSPLFGRIVAEAIVDLTSGELPSAIIEFGGGRVPQLAGDIVAGLQWKIPYYVIEKSAQKSIPSDTRVRYASSLSKLPVAARKNPFVIANEFLDALPVYWVENTRRGLREVFVEDHDAIASEELGSLSTPLLERYFKMLGSLPVVGNRAEVSLASLNWLGQLRRNLGKATILIFDYGRSAEHLFDLHRPKGTLRCFSAQEVDNNPYERVGEKDITADVNWTAIEKKAERLGFQKLLFLSQGRFLVRYGQKLLQEKRFSKKELLGFQTLVHPEWMGEAFQVMVLRKD